MYIFMLKTINQMMIILDLNTLNKYITSMYLKIFLIDKYMYSKNFKQNYLFRILNT